MNRFEYRNLLQDEDTRKKLNRISKYFGAMGDEKERWEFISLANELFREGFVHGVNKDSHGRG